MSAKPDALEFWAPGCPGPAPRFIAIDETDTYIGPAALSGLPL